MDSRLRPYAEYAMKVAWAYGLKPQVTSVFRGWAEQQRLRDRYLAGKSKWPANRPGDSAHNFGYAFDSWVPDAQMPTWRAIREYVGWRVPQNDVIHAGLPEWRKYRPSSYQKVPR